MADDLFQIHEILMPLYVGGSDDLLIVPYALIGAGGWSPFGGEFWGPSICCC